MIHPSEFAGLAGRLQYCGRLDYNWGVRVRSSQLSHSSRPQSGLATQSTTRAAFDFLLAFQNSLSYDTHSCSLAGATGAVGDEFKCWIFQSSGPPQFIRPSLRLRGVGGVLADAQRASNHKRYRASRCNQLLGVLHWKPTDESSVAGPRSICRRALKSLRAAQYLGWRRPEPRKILNFRDYLERQEGMSR